MGIFQPSISLKESNTVSPVPTSETEILRATSPDLDSTEVVDVVRYNKATLEIAFTLGALTEAYLKIYFTLDGTTWKQLTAQDVASGDISLTNLRIKLDSDFNGYFDFDVPAVRGIKVTVQGNGDNTGSSIQVKLGLREA